MNTQQRLLNRLPSLKRLRGVRDSVKTKYFQGLGTIGLNLTDLTYGGYWCTPRNSLTFAHTGGDGTHFSYILCDGELTDESPIVMTCPANSGDDSCVVVGDSLYDFLSLGFHCGYGILEQLSYSPDSFDVMKDPFLDENEEDADEDFTNEYRGCLHVLRSEFDLRPWKDWRNKLAELKSRFFDQLLIPFSDEIDQIIDDVR